MIKAPLLPQCPRIQITHTDRFVYNGRPYVRVNANEDGYRFQLEADYNSELRLSASEVYTALYDDRASVHYDYHTKRQTKLRLVVGDRLLKDFSQKRQLVAHNREQLILAYEKHIREHEKKPKDVELEKLLAKWTWELTHPEEPSNSDGASKKPKKRCDYHMEVYPNPCVRTFKRHYKEYMSCGRDRRALLPRYHGPGQKGLKFKCAASQAIWLEFARGYIARTKPSRQFQWEQCVAKIEVENSNRQQGELLLTPPTKKQFYALISKLDECDVMAGREGMESAKSYYKAKMHGFDVSKPGERVEFDDWCVDMMTVLTGCGVWQELPLEFQLMLSKQRIWIVAAIDVATRYILAIKATTTPTSSAVSEALQMVMSDKTHISQLAGAKTDWVGHLRPQNVNSDNGANYISDETQEKFQLCQIHYMHPAAGHPQRRPFIESLFSTLANDFMAYFDGRTFSNVVEKGNYDAEKCASLTSYEFMKLFVRAICDVYHLRPTAKLNGNTPHNAWVEQTTKNEILAVPNKAEMRHIFGVKVTRKISAAGIEVAGIPYNSQKLQELRQKSGRKDDFVVKFHPHSVHAVSVKIEDKWFSVPNTIGMDPSISLFEWNYYCEDLKKRNHHNVKPKLSDMYNAINSLRESGIAATMRAGLSPVFPSTKELQALEKQLSEGRSIRFEPESCDFKLLDPVINEDNFYASGLGSVVDTTVPEKVEVPSTELVEPNGHYDQF